MQQQQVEALGAAALEAALGGHADVAGVGALPAQPGVGEAGVALGALARALVEVVADGAHQAVVLAVDPGQRLAERPVGLSGAVGVGGDHRVDALARPQQREQPAVLERLAEAHEASAAPRSDRSGRGVHHRFRLKPVAVRARSVASRRSSAWLIGCTKLGSGPAAMATRGLGAATCGLRRR